MDFSTFLLNLALTAAAYLCVPMIIGFRGKKRTAKQIKRIVIINGAIVWFIFAIIRVENNIQGTGASVFLWSAIAHWLLKLNCLKEDSPDAAFQTTGAKERQPNAAKHKTEPEYSLSPINTGDKPFDNGVALESPQPVITTIPPISAKSESTPIAAPLHACRKCGRSLAADIAFCPYCGKKIQKDKKSKGWIILASVFLALILIAVSVVLYIINERKTISENYNNALAAVEEGNYMIAQKYLQQIDNYEELFPEDAEYISAAVLYEQGEYVQALKAFKKISPAVPVSIIEEISNEIYANAKELYANNAYIQARRLFTEIKDYKYSEKYLTLISAHVNVETDYWYDKLITIFDFEDAKEIINESEFYLQRFLMGEWNDTGSYHTFEMGENESWCSIPKQGKGDYYRIEDGIYQIGDDEYTDCYKFTIIDKSTILLYCYKDGKTYTMNRQ